MWCNRPPVREVCPNYEVVVFQPQIVTPLHLRSVAYHCTFKLGLPPHLFLLFSESFFSLLLPTTSPSIAIHWWSPLCFHPLPTSSLGLKRCLLVHHPHPPPASIRRSSLRPAPCALCLCLYLFPFMVRSPLFRPWPALRSLSSPGCFACRIAFRASIPWLALPELSSESWHRPVLGIVAGVNFCTRVEGQGTSTPCKSRALVLSLPATWPCCRRSGYPVLPPLPPSPSPPCRHDPIPIGRKYRLLR